MNILDVSYKLLNGADLWNMIKEAGLQNDARIASHYGIENQFLLTDVGMLQQPQQLFEALKFLKDKKIDTYFEVGTFYGTATLVIYSYLKRLNPNLTGITIDNADRGNGLVDYADSIGLKMIRGTSDMFKGYKSDLCFIDGDHSYEWVKRDFENIGKNAKYCMFHDIQDSWIENNGAERFWNEIKTTNDKEFLYHPEGDKYFGIGIKINE